jgi:hypothetical protein
MSGKVHDEREQTLEYEPRKDRSILGKGGINPNSDLHKFDQNVIPDGKLFTEENIRDSPELHKIPIRGRPFSGKMRGTRS